MDDRWARVLGLVLLMTTCVSAAQTRAVGDAHPKTIVLAFEGLDHDHVVDLMARGHLPGLSRLADQGALRPLASGPQASPVASWPSLNSGCNPGKTGVDGFVGRSVSSRMAGSPMPRLRLGVPTTLERTVAGRALEVPYFINPVQATSWWSRLDEVGVRTTAIGVPMTYPPDHEGPNTRLLPGLGLLDVGGSPGTWFVFVTNPKKERSSNGGRFVELTFDGDGRRAETELPGPVDFLARKRTGRRTLAERPFTVTADRQTGRVEVEIGEHRLDVAVGDWSPPIPVTFTLRPLPPAALRRAGSADLRATGESGSNAQPPLDAHRCPARLLRDRGRRHRRPLRDAGLGRVRQRPEGQR